MDPNTDGPGGDSTFSGMKDPLRLFQSEAMVLALLESASQGIISIDRAGQDRPGQPPGGRNVRLHA